MDAAEAVKRAESDVQTMLNAAGAPTGWPEKKTRGRSGRREGRKAAERLRGIWRFLPEEDYQRLMKAAVDAAVNCAKEGKARSLCMIMEAIGDRIDATDGRADGSKGGGTGVNFTVNNQQASALPTPPQYTAAVRQLQEMERRALPLNGDSHGDPT